MYTYIYCESLSQAEPRIPKQDVVAKLAKEAGHALDAQCRCAKCRLQLNMSRSLAFHQATLHTKCLGGSSIRANLVLHTKPKEDDAEEFQHYLFHKLAIHKSHCMATHGLLQLRFCTYCGAYGRDKACHLKKACPMVPSKGGMQALRMLSQDINPGFRKEHPRDPKAHSGAGISRKCSLGKLRKAKEAYKAHRCRLKALQAAHKAVVSQAASRKRKVATTSAPLSPPFETGPDLANQRSSINAMPSLRSAKAASDVCHTCWPLGASELGYCICADLEICKVPPSVSTKIRQATVTRKIKFLVTAMDSQSPGSSSLEQFSSPVCNTGSSSGQSPYDTDMPSLPRPQEASTCSRCWPLGASELGYCICGDLAIAGILPPAV